MTTFNPSGVSESWDLEDGEGRVEIDLFADAVPDVIYLEVFDSSGRKKKAACVAPTPREAREIAAALIRAADTADAHAST